MTLPPIVIPLILLQQCISADAQVRGRPGNANTHSTGRNTDAEKKKMTGMKYDSLINKSQQKINKLSAEISELQQQVVVLKKQVNKQKLIIITHSKMYPEAWQMNSQNKRKRNTMKKLKG